MCCLRYLREGLSVGAISVYKGLYADVSAKCVGCGRCSGACPASVIEMQEVTP